MDWIDRIYQRLDYPWYLNPLMIVWVFLPVGMVLSVYALLAAVKYIGGYI